MKKTILKAVAVIAAALLILKGKKMVAYTTLLTDFFMKHEGFKASPYWDYKQWSIGYGTSVPFPYEVEWPDGWAQVRSFADSQYIKSTLKPKVPDVSRVQAMVLALKHVEKDKAALNKMVTIDLDSNQWAALLSFTYNLGQASAEKLMPNLNAKKWADLEKQWKLYVNAGGKKLDALVSRRNDEWKLFSKNLSYASK